MDETEGGGGASAISTKSSRVADWLRQGGSGDIHPNAFHRNACMTAGDGSRYCGWLLHGHPWCGTHGHQCEDLPLEEQDVEGRRS